MENDLVELGIHLLCKKAVELDKYGSLLLGVVWLTHFDMVFGEIDIRYCAP